MAQTDKAMGKETVIDAPAKINLSLDVIGKRENGYHDVRMIMQQISLHDTITITVEENGNKGSCTDDALGLITVGTNSGELPVNEDNLVYKAAKLIMDECRISDPVRIFIDKHIPIAAGLAGGSSDAAAVLKGMNSLFDLKLSDAKLKDIGVRIGADVPYCITGGTAIAEGIGEVLTPLPSIPDCYILIAKPGISVSTGYVYTAFDSLVDKIHPDVDAMISVINEGNLQGIAALLGNSLEGVTQEEYPVIKEIKRLMLDNGAMGALMSGSGPTVFGLYRDKESALAGADEVKKSGKAQDIEVTEPLNKDNY